MVGYDRTMPQTVATLGYRKWWHGGRRVRRTWCELETQCRIVLQKSVDLTYSNHNVSHDQAVN